MKKNATLVYIIVPLYNSEKYLLETLMSIYYQNYTNWYLIIVNDGSTDNSENIARDFISHYNLHTKVKVITKENGGVNSAVQRGLEEVKKNGCDNCLVTYLDSDDVWVRDKLEIQVEFMLNNPNCGLSYHDMVGVDSNGKLNSLSIIGLRYNENPSFLFFSTMGNFIASTEIMFWGKYLDYILPMPTGKNCFQDYRTVLVISLFNVGVLYIDKPLAFYRNGYLSLSASFRKDCKERYLGVLNMLDFLQRRFSKKDLSEVINYNNDRLDWENKKYPKLLIYILMTYKYPKIFFVGFFAQVRRFFRHGIYTFIR